MNRGWWKLTFTGVDELTDTDKEHIAKLITEGYTQGEIVQEEGQYKVTAKALVPNKELHQYDREERVAGSYEYKALSEDDALDQFHDHVPIKMLDDFEITVKQI